MADADRVARGGDVVASALAAAAEHGAQWFPQLDAARLRVAPAGRRQDRPRGLLVRLRLHDGRREAFVVVKARKQSRGGPETSRSATRPVMVAAGQLPEVEMARREFDGLSMIWAAFGDRDSARYAVARPLTWLPEHAGFVMDHVADPTMRQQLMARSRLRPGGAQLEDAAWVNAGAWLRIYHGLRPAGALQPRLGQRARVAELFEPYAEFLAGRAGHAAFFAALARVGAQRAEAALPGDLPLVVGHGDFVVRNLFESPTGRITVIDPMPRWLAPAHEDLARFVVGMRMLGLQVLSHGLAFGQQQLDGYEAGFLRGYFGEDPVPWEELRAFQLLILMDKWSAAVRAAPRNSAGRLAHAAQQHWFDNYFRREARRMSAV